MARKDPEVAQHVGDGVSAWVVPAIVVAVAALLIGGVIWMNTDDDEPTDPAASASAAEQADAPHPEEVAVPDLSDQEARDPADLLAVGPVDAPVAMVVFSDFQCAYCAKWSAETLPTLLDYVERGEQRIEFRDVNIYGEDSERGARAALAAAKQDALIEYHAALFPDGEIRSGEQLSEDALVQTAADLGLDPEQFRADLNAEETAQVIAANAQQGLELGTMSTPAFIIGGTPTVGAQPTEEFTRMVDEALAEAEGEG